MISPPSSELSGFEFSEELHRGRTTVILRGIRKTDQLPVVVKKLKEGSANFADVVRLQHEFDIISSIQSAHVVRAEGMVKHNGSSALILKDRGGTSLGSYLNTTRLDIRGFLEIAVQLATALRDIHARHVIHKDFNPSNIIILPDTRLIEVIDFGIASQLPAEDVLTMNPSTLEGTLAYISPEQTGRMNRSVDYRTDLYSLGVTLYESLIGWPPFQARDPMELIHCHIARVPAAPHVLNAMIPKPISDIIMKLLAKTAEERYQNASGLLHDLQRCREEWNSHGRVKGFVIGERDVSERFLVPQQLYGREEESASLLEAFDRICTGGSGLVLVSGEAGIGKSALVHEVHKPIVRKRGFFVTGKFDQFNRDIPYASVTQAFQGLVDQLLSSSPKEIEELRRMLLDALGANGKVVSGVIPEIELIIGEQPPVQELPPTESQNRFNVTMLGFVRALAREDHPLVLFLDDLQWADQASLSLIRHVMHDPQLNHFLLIGAYRNEEVAVTHRLASFRADLEESGVRITWIPLQQLGDHVVERAIADTLRMQSVQCHDLATIVTAKTGGNPYFTIEFLKALHQENLLRFDPMAKEWTWNLAEIQQRSITENVVSLMAGKIQRLSPNAQRGLKYAACVGNSFDLQTLSSVLVETMAHTADDLWPAINEGLIIPLGDGYKFVHGIEEGLQPESQSMAASMRIIRYRFSHDRVQQAAYALMSQEEARDLHRAIGQQLYRAMVKSGEDDHIFEIVNHLNLGLNPAEGGPERDNILGLNLLAGRKAKSSAAFGPALHYFSRGAAFLRSGDWESHYAVARDLLMEKGECEHLAGAFRDSEATFDAVLERVHSAPEKGRVYALKIELYIHQSLLAQALENGIEALRILGVPLSPHPGKLRVLTEMAVARLRMKGRKIPDLVHLPFMVNENAKVGIDILMSLFGIAYSLSEEMSGLVISKMMNLTLRFGNADVSAYVYGLYGLLVSAGFGAYRSGYALATLGLRLSEKSHNILLRGRCRFVVGCLHNHWHSHALTNGEYLTAGYRDSMESGDLLYASYSLSQQAILAVVTGLSLDIVHRKALEYLEFVRGIHHEDIEYYFVLIGQFVRNLRGQTERPESLRSDSFDDQEFVQKLDATQFTSPRMYYRVLMVQLCYLHGKFDDAIKMVEDSKGLRHALIGQVVEAEFNLYHSLSLAALVPTSRSTLKRRHLKTIASNQRQMRRWADLCPQNFLHKYQLVAAEQARAKGRIRLAEVWYDKAIDAAREQGYIQVEALAYELAAKMYMDLGRERIAKTYLQEARNGYAKWGATGKVAELETAFPQYLTRWGENAGDMMATAQHSVTTTTRTSMPALELVSVLKASQALSGEIVLDKLLGRMMTIVLENAGAQRGFLILDEKDHLVIRAGLDVGTGSEVMLDALPLEGTSQLSESIVRQVARTRESVILHDAAEEGRYLRDAYVTDARPKSILCIPVMRQGELNGILYLENNLTTYAFTPERLEVLRLLSSQIAVSLENARLYTQERELARIQEQLRLAATIQRELLPKSDPRLPGYEIAGANLPAQVVGGDYYDFIRLDDQRLAVCIGDVSGKGFPASLLMANLQASLRGQSVLTASPKECIGRSNRLLYESTSPEKYATVFYGVLDAANHRIVYSNAGHEHPLLLNGQEGAQELTIGGIALGMLEEFPFEEAVVDFGPGDTLVMYSDGITEAMNALGEQFGRARLDHILLSNKELPVAELMAKVVENVKGHVGSAPQSDDITLVIIRRSR